MPGISAKTKTPMTSLLNIFSALSTIVSTAAQWFGRRQLIKAGEAQAKAQISEEALEKINTANRARLDAGDASVELRDKWARD